MLPPMPYGVSHHHLTFPWTLSVRPDTLSAVVRDVAESLLRHGIAKLLVLSAHDGNAPVAQVAARHLSQEHAISVAVFSGWQRKSRTALAEVHAIDLDHAGQSETSLTLYAAPETVRLNLASAEPNEPPGLAIEWSVVLRMSFRAGIQAPRCRELAKKARPSLRPWSASWSRTFVCSMHMDGGLGPGWMALTRSDGGAEGHPAGQTAGVSIRSTGRRRQSRFTLSRTCD